jgi:hypothetical protein
VGSRDKSPLGTVKLHRKKGPLVAQAKLRPDRVAKVQGEEWQQVDPEGMDDKLRDLMYKMNPKQVGLFCAWIVNGRNITQAARQVGYSPEHARKMFTTHPAFTEAKNYIGAIMTLEDQEWIDCLPQARQTMRSLMLAKDEKVRFWAAKDIVDRAEGKPTSRVDMTIRDDRPSLSDGQLQLVISLMQTHRISFAEAKAHVEAHPDEAARWIASNVTKTLGTPKLGSSPVADAKEVVREVEALESRINATDPEAIPEEPPMPPSSSRSLPEGSSEVVEVQHRPLIARLD